jgi:SAM-dependent methyltransferase
MSSTDADAGTDTDTRPGTEKPWQGAGRSWGHAATDWAYLFEPYARDAIEAVFARTGVGPGTSLLDVACGAGLGLGRAARLGASTAGIDASERLLQIAERRAPGGDVRAGDMFSLPWADGSFDVATSFNGVWGGCGPVVTEMGRVLRPGGQLALTFWGASHDLDLLGYFLVLGSARADVADEITTLAQIGDPGVAEEMIADAGLGLMGRGSTAACLEWPDEDVAWRALRSPGLAVPPLESLGEVELRSRVLDAIEPFRASDGSYSLTNALTHVIARRPR